MGRKKKEIKIIDPYDGLSDEDRITMLIRDSKIRPTRLVNIFGEDRFNQIMSKAAELKAIKIILTKPSCDSMSVFPYSIEMYTTESLDDPYYVMGEILDVDTIIKYTYKYDPYKMEDFWGIKFFLKRNMLYGFIPIGDGAEYKVCWTGELIYLEQDVKDTIMRYSKK